MADPSTPGERPLRGMIDPALHPLPGGFRPTPDEAVAADTPLDPTASFGAPAGPGFRHAGSPLTPAPPDDDAGQVDDSDADADADELDLGQLDLDQLDLGDGPARPSRVAASVRRQPLRAAVLVLAVLVMVSGVGLGATLFRDARQTYTADEVMSALQGFRTPSGRTQVSSVNGWRDELTVSPLSCTALVTQSPPEAADGAQWISTDGTGYERVQVQTVRFSTPATARAVLHAMVDGSADCERVLVKWQDDSPRWVTIRSATSSTGLFAAREELSYALRSSYGGQVYVRQFGNVIAFVSGIVGVESGRQLSDDLVAELQSLSTS